MRTPVTASAIRAFISAREDTDVLRVHYCYQIGSTFVNLALMEDAIANAMLACDRIKVANLLGSDASNWRQLIDKKNRLQSSTLGNLISILSKHNIEPSDFSYLNWVKDRRNFFVHRFFHRGGWPGDLEDDDIEIFCRELLYLELIFARASRRIWRIFGRANLMDYHDLGKDGVLMTNIDLFKQDDWK